MNVMAKNIRTLRGKRQMTQAQLAESLGVRFQTVSKWETGTTLPDTMLLPALADVLEVSLDELFGRRFSSCAKEISGDTRDFLLCTYARMYDPEAGPWNLSVENKYLEYRITAFFENHFQVAQRSDICNIGIGAGEWDRYLSYKLKDGSLTSIDREPVCCKQLEQRLIWEGNPKEVTVVCADAMELELAGRFEIVTMVGSTAVEGGPGMGLLEKAMDFVKPGGSLYYHSLDEQEDCNAAIKAAYRHGLELKAIQEEKAWGFSCRYYKFTRSIPGK